MLRTLRLRFLSSQQTLIRIRVIHVSKYSGSRSFPQARSPL